MKFSQQEFQKRYERARELMRANDLDALFVTEKSNYSYFTPHRTIGWASKTRPIIFVLPLNEEPSLLLHEWESGNARSSCPWIKNMKTWVDLPFSISPLTEMFKSLRLTNARIGAELGYEQRLNMPFNDFEKLKKEMPKATFVDASNVFWQLRAIKSNAEVENIRKACVVMSDSIEKTLEEVEDGISEKELARKLYIHVIEGGGDRPGIAALCGSPESYERESQMPSESIIKRGNELFIDTGCIYDEYWSDMSRAAVLGKPTEQQKKMYSLFRKATEKHIEMVRPGVKASEIADSCLDYIRKSGLTTWGVGRMGHGIGLDFTEPPSVTLSDNTVLKEGMVITIEPGTITPYGVFCLEDVVRITKDGTEMLTTANRDLIEI